MNGRVISLPFTNEIGVTEYDKGIYMKGSLVACLPTASGELLVAQDVPGADLFFGYSFIRHNSAQTIPAFTANGGIGTANQAAGTYQIGLKAKVSDGKGIGSADTQAVVKKKAVVTSKRLPDVMFQHDSARVNNCGKRLLLEELKTYTDDDPTGTVYFIGHQSANEKVPELEMKRAMNAAAVISAGTGVCSAFPATVRGRAPSAPAPGSPMAPFS